METATFDKFGRVGYVSDTKVSMFIGRLGKGEPQGTKCKKCGTLYFPPRADCSKCLTSETEWVRLSGECELLTYSKLEYAPSAFKNYAPYVLAVAKLREGPRVFAPVARDVNLDRLKPGLKMILDVNRNNDRVYYELRPATTGG